MHVLFLASANVNNFWERENAHGRSDLPEPRRAARDASEGVPIGRPPVCASSLWVICPARGHVALHECSFFDETTPVAAALAQGREPE
jgi:hypothetical protein